MAIVIPDLLEHRAGRAPRCFLFSGAEVERGREARISQQKS